MDYSTGLSTYHPITLVIIFVTLPTSPHANSLRRPISYICYSFFLCFPAFSVIIINVFRSFLWPQWWCGDWFEKRKLDLYLQLPLSCQSEHWRCWLWSTFTNFTSSYDSNLAARNIRSKYNFELLLFRARSLCSWSRAPEVTKTHKKNGYCETTIEGVSLFGDK